MTKQTITFGGRQLTVDRDPFNYTEKPISLVLQGLPPSANSIWRAVDGKVLKSAEYRSWLKEQAWDLKAQAGSRRMRGHYELTVTFGKLNNRRMDLDNRLKPLGDLLVASGIVRDDSYCQRITASWGSEPGITRIVLTSAEAP